MFTKKFDIKTVIPRVAESITAPALHFKQVGDSPVSIPPFTPDPSYFLDMFGHHPMAQFFVPDAHKSGGGEDIEVVEGGVKSEIPDENI